ncbi:DUF4249 domain-containing protein [Flavobacterium salilacus subsp. salilacus]|uniref:DUF4249 domain-containing protein n=1 Tax=Flavobacterium TaxID=237 RepID=UPI001074CA23|nr:MULTISPECIES: DUF4249 domain-containing protein [Flavobacterium]KAF2518619.1 DUF4249 domain-containing protein [Flavobacterium salilacus subsp. salilacus]MBE1613576.1 DUF4249 domain-containing protein [Flavobacterium sp. SaA2.13]
MKNIRLAILLIIGSMFIACEDVVDIDLDTAAPRLVVEASIDWVKGTDGSEQTIRLTTTTGYYEEEVPIVSGAVVYITNSSNTVFNFIEDMGTGNYICADFEPIIGETYQLTIEYNGETHTATETLYAVPEISSVVQDDEGGFLNEDIEVRFFFQDNPNEDNYYLIRFDTEVLPYPDYDVLDDEFFQGNEMFSFIDNEDFETGQEVGIQLYGISQRYYNYMSILIATAEGGAGGGPFQTVPVAARGNLTNQNNPDNYAYGYFRLTEVDTTLYTIQ